MKKLLLFNLVLTGIVSILFLTSGTNVETFREEKLLHHFENNILIPNMFREFDTETYSYVVRTCAEGTVFDCINGICTTASKCPCTD